MQPELLTLTEKGTVPAILMFFNLRVFTGSCDISRPRQAATRNTKIFVLLLDPSAGKYLHLQR
jgi:hypothetical protein